MRRIAALALVSAALAGAAAGPAQADLVGDLGITVEGLATLPAGFDLSLFDPLSIQSNIIVSKPNWPIDMDASGIRNPPGQAAERPAASAKKTKQARRAKHRRHRR